MSFSDDEAARPVDPASHLDWSRLFDAAAEARRVAYSPYSGYLVGAAALVDDGRIVSGCNVANASFGLGLCAECGLVSSLVLSGGGRLVAFVCLGPNDSAVSPCGRCRQLLFEHGGADLLIWSKSGVATLRHLLPDPFSAADLETYNRPQEVRCGKASTDRPGPQAVDSSKTSPPAAWSGASAGIEDIGYLVKSLQQALRNQVGAKIEQLGLRMPDFTALSVIKNSPGISNVQLARLCFVTPQTMHQVLLKLEAMGYIFREPKVGASRGERIAHVTPDGAAALRKCLRFNSETHSKMLQGLDEQQSKQLADLLAECLRNLSS